MMAQEIREYLAEIGVRSLHELVGRTDLLETNEAIKHWKSQGLVLAPLLHRPDVGPDIKIRNEEKQIHDIEDILDRDLIAAAAPALERRESVVIERDIFNYNRSACTMLSGAVAKAHGVEGLPQGTITVKLKGVAGQSFGTFLAPGVDLFLEGEANDYVVKAGWWSYYHSPRRRRTAGIKTRSLATPSCTVRLAARSSSAVGLANGSASATLV